MKFYAAQGTGFHPSLSRIESETGIDKYTVSRTRALLVKYGLIGYNDESIVIDWTRLRAFASLDSSKMGNKRSWSISPLVSAKPESKFDLHNYIGKLNLQDQRVYAAYAATAQAMLDGVSFPELEGKQIPEIDPASLEEGKFDLHNYIGDENSCGWYNPFDEPDPLWVYQLAVIDAYGEIMGYVHYDTQLPF